MYMYVVNIFMSERLKMTIPYIETPDITSFTVTIHTACIFKWDLQIKLNSFVLHKYKAIKKRIF